jgi:hypothetical protein
VTYNAGVTGGGKSGRKRGLPFSTQLGIRWYVRLAHDIWASPLFMEQSLSDGIFDGILKNSISKILY